MNSTKVEHYNAIVIKATEEYEATGKVIVELEDLVEQIGQSLDKQLGKLALVGSRAEYYESLIKMEATRIISDKLISV